jgi:hypothetical protein
MRFTLPHDHGEARACLLIHLGPLTPTITNQTSPHFAEALLSTPGLSKSAPIARTCLSLDLAAAALGCRSASGAGKEAFGDGSDRLALDLGL